MVGGATDWTNVLPVGKGLEAATSLAGKGAQALKLGEAASKGGQLLDKALSSKPLLHGLLSVAGLKAHGLEGMFAAQALEPIIKQAVKGGKVAGKGLINALKATGEDTMALDNGILSFNKSTKIPSGQIAAGLLREKMAEERAQP